MTDLKQAVMRTIIYADCFDYALTPAQIHQYLISDKKYLPATLKTALYELVASERLLCQSDLYCIPGRNYLFLRRKITETVSATKIEIARKQIRLMTYIPWIDGIWITGNVAMSNAQDEDDIDILIVTRDSCVWLTRFIILLVYGAIGHLRFRRHSLHSVKNKLCLNMYLDTTALKMPPNKRNLYIAHEVVQVMPLFDRNKTYERFLAANAWMLKYLPHAQGIELEKNATRLTLTPLKLMQRLNRWLFTLQYHYMKNHLSREFVDEHRAFFHPRNTSTLVTQKYEKRCNTFGISA